MNRKQHWEKVYETKTDQEVGWYEEYPMTSLQLVEKYATNNNDSLINVGGGNSFLSKILFEKGMTDLTIVDISSKALERNRMRFGQDEEKIKWIRTNILKFTSDKQLQIWHDRAVFHFLIKENEIRRYAEIAGASIKPGGYLLIGTFSLSGPNTCSGLPITQYGADELSKVFEGHFDLLESFGNTHTTPSGNKQNFCWAVFRRN